MDAEPLALDSIVNRHLAWLTERVEQELGPKLRAKTDVADVVQQALLEFVKYAPRLVVRSDAELRALLLRIVRNVLADQDDFFAARCRAIARERPLASDSVVALDPPRDLVSSPSHAVQRDEETAWVRLALSLLEPEERKLLVMREWEQVPFAEIGATLGIGEAAARMRHHRAVLRLSSVVVRLKSGDLAAAVTAPACSAAPR
jgi:RNA polymerase sigma-70 factor (ECF subfamily)